MTDLLTSRRDQGHRHPWLLGQPEPAAVASAFTAACLEVTAAYPIPADMAYLSATGNGQHAVRRCDALEHMQRCGLSVSEGVCGQLTRLRLPFTAWTAAGDELCPECAWTVAAETATLGDTIDQLLAPESRDWTVLAGLMPDPLIASRTAGALLRAWRLTHGVDCPPDAALVQLLAEVTRHQPVTMRPEDCMRGDCGHPGEDCPPETCTVVCAACSTRAGQWAEGWVGTLIPGLVITPPCAVLTALSAKAAASLKAAASTGWTAGAGSQAALPVGRPGSVQ